MGPFRDPALGLDTPGIRKVSGRLYLADNQFMYNTGFAGMRLYYVPDEEVQRLDRRTGRVEFGALCLMVIALLGAGLRAWSVWWFLPALAAPVLAAPVLVGGSVRERYPAVTDPAIVRGVRRRVAMDHPPLWTALAMFLVTAPSLISGLSHKRDIVFGFAVMALVTEVIRLLAGLRARRALREESPAS